MIVCVCLRLCLQETPLHLSAANDCAVAVEYLLSEGADAFAVNVFGQTPKAIAVVKGAHKSIAALNGGYCCCCCCYCWCCCC